MNEKERTELLDNLAANKAAREEAAGATNAGGSGETRQGNTGIAGKLAASVVKRLGPLSTPDG